MTESVDIKFLKGVGPARAAQLAAELDIHTIEDLLLHFPSRYVDRSRIYRISELGGEMTQLQIKGQFVRFMVEGEGKRARLTGLFTDGFQHMEVVWFSSVRHFREAYHTGVDYILFGKPSSFHGIWSMAHPEVEPYDPAKPPQGMAAVYPLTDNLRRRSISQQMLRRLVDAALVHPWFTTMQETLPVEIVRAYRLMPLGEAVYNLHKPVDQHALAKARERIKFEELYYLELHILRYARRRQESVPGYHLPKVGRAFNRFYSEVLPFQLTNAQKRVLREIRGDMTAGRQMNRLLQGDVGSGKTMVAFMTLLLAVDNGMQACIMAPTEILASQHYDSISGWCGSLGLECRLLTGSTRVAERREIHDRLLDGSLNIIVGTHALLEEKVEFRRLGIAVIDEQHRFGVAQRARLWSKGTTAPHVLVMTATPIPRTLAMTVYGDLEVSVIDELPPGRKPVETHLVYESNRMAAYRLIQRQLDEGRQAYIVYPLIRENEKLSLKSVEKGLERIAGIFPGVEICCVHGQMKPAEKDAQMQRFVEGKARIMVATTVIEVGVNVPNATVMLIENAERFGLSQLHQLRGRVGRGADRSYCVLMSHDGIKGDTRRRLNIMTETTDGFVISEADMKLRGPGDMEGTQQSGLAFSLRLADLTRDSQILTVARQAAASTLDAFPELYAASETDSAAAAADRHAFALNLVRSQLSRRFPADTDWSRIS